MGVIQTRSGFPLVIKNPVRKNTNQAKYFDPSSSEPVLSIEDAITLKKAWSQIKDEITKVGIVTFMK